ncbi:hypothetical protein [Paraburkholderia sp. RL17-373-BIF-A]|uniref:hypothetical protein n=1 Tax=Paraburkholderia sp. RL17-373-BIF-A TaxID=3031629 RepID=UPI0038BCDB41
MSAFSWPLRLDFHGSSARMRALLPYLDSEVSPTYTITMPVVTTNTFSRVFNTFGLHDEKTGFADMVMRGAKFGNAGGAGDLVLSILTFGIYALVKSHKMDLKKAAVEETLKLLREQIQANPGADSVSVQVDGQELTVSYKLHAGLNRLKITLGAHEFEPIDGVTLKDLRARLENVNQPFAGDDVHHHTPDTLRHSAARVERWEPDGAALLQRIQLLPARERETPLKTLVDRIAQLPEEDRSTAFGSLLVAVRDLDGAARQTLLNILVGRIIFLPPGPQWTAFDGVLAAVRELYVTDRGASLDALASQIWVLSSENRQAAFDGVLAAVQELDVKDQPLPLARLSGQVWALPEGNRKAARDSVDAAYRLATAYRSS